MGGEWSANKFFFCFWNFDVFVVLREKVLFSVLVILSFLFSNKDNLISFSLVSAVQIQ